MPYKGYTQAQNKATQKYQKENMDQIAIRVPKGKREIYRNFAEKNSESLAGMIVRLIEKEMENSNKST